MLAITVVERMGVARIFQRGGGGGGVGGSHCVKQRVLALSQPEYR